MTSNTLSRLAVFLIGIPALIGSAFVLPAFGLPVFAVLVVGASAIAAREIRDLLPAEHWAYPGGTFVPMALAALLPAVGYVTELLAVIDYEPLLPGIEYNPSTVVVAAMILSVATLLAFQALGRERSDFSGIIAQTASHLFILVYPGLFAWHATRIISFANSSWLVIVFLLACYLNDSAAWTAGKLLGGIERRLRTRPVVAVSPNKSLVGFLFGFLASPALVVLVGLLFPDVLPGTVPRHAALGAIVGVAGIVGDLVESALKRSASVKDSGSLIPGRGGLLDSIDSPLFAAPFFFYGAVVLLQL